MRKLGLGLIVFAAWVLLVTALLVGWRIKDAHAAEACLISRDTYSKALGETGQREMKLPVEAQIKVSEIVRRIQDSGFPDIQADSFSVFTFLESQQIVRLVLWKGKCYSHDGFLTFMQLMRLLSAGEET